MPEAPGDLDAECVLCPFLSDCLAGSVLMCVMAPQDEFLNA